MPSVPGFAAPLKALTVVPWGMEEGTGLRIPNREFRLVVGEPAEFRFFTSAVRKNDQPGDLIEDFGDDLEELAPMEVNLPAEQHAADVVPVSFETVVTETGMLQGADLRGTNLDNADLRNANLQGMLWKNIRSIEKANIHGVRNAEEGFAAWAMQHNAISVTGEE